MINKFSIDVELEIKFIPKLNTLRLKLLIIECLNFYFCLSFNSLISENI
jgi:hypothetical protein